MSVDVALAEAVPEVKRAVGGEDWLWVVRAEGCEFGNIGFESCAEAVADFERFKAEYLAMNEDLDKARERIDPPKQGPADQGDQEEPEHTTPDHLPPITQG